MSFSRAQQPAFQALKQRAWQAECRLLGAAFEDADAARAWYEDELEAATGHRSSTACNPTRDYEAAMAHFEALAGDDIYWQMRKFSGNRRRILHAIRTLAADFDCDDAYMLGIARQALQIHAVVEWDALQANELLLVRNALLKQVRRQLRRGDRTDRVRRVEEAF
jgi:hypothetical protein